MKRPHWLRPPHRILSVFLGIMCVLGGALAWLWWQLLVQDRELESQRVREKLELAADRIAGVLSTESQEFVRLDDGVTLVFGPNRAVTVQPSGRLLYLPASTDTAPPDAIFDEGERSEFQGHDSARAAGIFRALAASPKPDVRAGALLRLARNLRKQGLNREAVVVYGQLAALKDAAIEGVPVELLALDALAAVFQAMGESAELRRQAQAMDEGLRSCRWSLPGPAWDFYRQEAARWAQTPALTVQERQSLALSRAAEWVSKLGPHFPEPKGRRILAEEDGPVMVSWSATGERLTAVLIPPQTLLTAWKLALVGAGVQAALVDTDGSILLGSLAGKGRRAGRSPADIGLPATLVVTPLDPTADAADFALHRRFLYIGLCVVLLVLAAGSGFILHSIRRERALSQLQTEFVSAVSHEFRTPLTSLRHLSEMLDEGRIQAEPERRQAYGAMFHATKRLQRLVESLLDFGRMEAAAVRYCADPVDVAGLVESVTREFKAQTACRHEIHVQQMEGLPFVRGDREALGVALWNLLDNGVKYSPGAAGIWVETSQQAGDIAIAVRDAGLGIAAAEQGRVFERFVRGSLAAQSNITGTGIGLSMSRHIVRAHGGEIRLSSEPGKGSTFTIVLPVERQV